MSNRLIYLALLFMLALMIPKEAHAQVLVFSHTNIESETLLPACGSEMQDPFTELDYPFADAFCQLIQNGVVIQSWNCFANPTAICAPAGNTDLPSQLGANYQTTGRHGLVFAEIAGGCNLGTVFLNPCYWDPLNYGTFADRPPFAPNITDIGFIQPRGGLETFTGPSTANSNNFLIGNSAETPFTVPLVNPPGHSGLPKDSVTFTADRTVDWTFEGVGTTVPSTPFRGTTIVYHAPANVAGDQLDVLHACDLNRATHGAICAPVRIRTLALDVSISGPVELFPSQQHDYLASVFAGPPAIPVSQAVTWSIVSDPSGLATLDAQSGHFTAPPLAQVVFPLDITIKATSNLDTSRSATLLVHIPVTTIKVNDPITSTPFVITPTGTVFLATPNATLDFSATVNGPILSEDRVPRWKPIKFNPVFNTQGDGTIDQNGVYTFPNNPVILKLERIAVIACVGGQPDASFTIFTDEICDTYILQAAPATTISSPPIIVNSGETTIIAITGTGFNASPTVTFGDPNITAVVNSTSTPDPTTGSTTISATVTAPPVPSTDNTTLNVTSTLPPPAVPATQAFRARAVNLTPAVTPGAATVLISGSQQFIGTLACQTFGGQTCFVPQTFTCSISPTVGTMNASTCLYTAPASVATASTVTGQACSTFGGRCAAFSINLVPVTVAVSPAAISLNAGQTQQFTSTVTNAPNNNQGTTWSISPAAGSISATGFYTAPSVLTSPQTVTVTGCSVVDPSRCSTATVSLVIPDFALSVSPGNQTIAVAFQTPFNVSVTPSGLFAGNVALSATVPSGIGLTANFAPAVIAGSGTSSLQFQLTSSTPAGTYPVTVTATSGGLVHSVQITVTVVIASLALTVDPPKSTLGGQTVVFNFNVTNNNFFGAVSVNVTGVPAGISYFQVPGTFFGGGPGTVTMTVPAGFAPGTYPLTLTASGAGLTATANTSLIVQSPPPPPPPPDPPPPRPCGTRICIDQP